MSNSIIREELLALEESSSNSSGSSGIFKDTSRWSQTAIENDFKMLFISNNNVDEQDAKSDNDDGNQDEDEEDEEEEDDDVIDNVGI